MYISFFETLDNVWVFFHFFCRPTDHRLSSAINALDLENLDLRYIDPVLASKLLEEIRSGADVRPLLEKLKRPMISAGKAI